MWARMSGALLARLPSPARSYTIGRDSLSLRYTVIPGERDQIIYYLHGLGRDENEWRRNKIARSLGDVFQPQPTVIGVSFGRDALLLENRDGGRLQFLVDEALEIIEGQHQLAPRERFLMGESLGGHNAAQIYLHRPEVFDRVVLIAPAILPMPDERSFVSAWRMGEAVGANISARLRLSLMWRTKFGAMLRQNQPLLTKVERLASVDSPPLFVTCGQHDQWGFHDSGREFAARARSRGAQVVWQSVPGSHSTADPHSIAGFLGLK